MQHNSNILEKQAQSTINQFFIDFPLSVIIDGWVVIVQSRTRKRTENLGVKMASGAIEFGCHCKQSAPLASWPIVSAELGPKHGPITRKHGSAWNATGPTQLRDLV